MQPNERVTATACRGGRAEHLTRSVPEETAIAFSYNGSAYAVMMATPDDLMDFAVGFSLTGRFIDSAEGINSIEIAKVPEGIDLRIWLPQAQARTLLERRRAMAGPTGCGLCGVESLAEAMRPPSLVTAAFTATPAMIVEALASLAPAQMLNRKTRAVHAAAHWQPGKGLVALREDVGRHNALDKLAGALAREHVDAGHGVTLITSRVSIEMVQKASVIGTPILVAVSAPTALAIRTADAAGITLVAVARGDEFEVFTHPGRIVMEASADVA